MAQAVFGSPLQAVEGETKTLDATTVGYVALKPGFHEVKLYCASAWRLALAPALRVVSFYDTSAGTYTNYASQATDRSSSTHVQLDSMANLDYLYLGSTDPTLGYYIDMGTNVNAIASTLATEYSTTAQVADGSHILTPIAWTALTETDGTLTSTTTTLTVDGLITWTLPTDWVRSALPGVTAELLYWVRFTPSATLSTAVDVNEIIPVYQNISYAYMEAGTEYQFALNIAKLGALVVLSTSGTPTLNISWLKH